jgi:hypothetical protein
MKNLVLLALMALSLFLILVGDLRIMLIGVLVGIAALDIQSGLNAAMLSRGILGLEEDLIAPEKRLTASFISRSDELERRLAENAYK